MKRSTQQMLIFSFSLVVVLGVYGLMMFGLADFNSTTNDSGIRVDGSEDTERNGFELFTITENTTAMEIGRQVGYILWETRGIDIILVGIILMVASESAATMVKGIEDQCSEFRAEMCDTDKFVILEQKEAEELEEE